MKNLKSFLQSCNKSLINQACSGPYWENIGPRSFLYGPRCARSVLSRPRADILPVRPSRLVNKIYYYMANPVLGKFLRSDWFFLGQDFAVRTVSMETVQPVYFCFGAKPANSKFATKTAKKKCEYCHSSQ